MGYRASAESVETRFPYADSTRQVKPFTVCFNDGFTKILLMTSILCFIHELDSWLEFINHVFFKRPIYAVLSGYPIHNGDIY